MTQVDKMKSTDAFFYQADSEKKDDVVSLRRTN